MKFWRLVFSRLTIIALFLLIQLIIFFVFTLSLSEFFIPYQIASLIVGLIVFLKIINTYGPPEHKIPWIAAVLVMPLFGVFLYFIFHKNRPSLPQRKAFQKIEEQTVAYLEESHEPQRHADQLEQLGDAAGQSCHLYQATGMGAYSDTKSTYYPTGEAFWEALLVDLKRAKHFIFLEYFIIEEGIMWNGILEILKEKAAAGVDVRLIYDDVGSMGFINTDFVKQMESQGIQCRIFNKIVPFVNMFMNNRDHRKITVIDGQVGFTGGYNLADEYFNITHPYGLWKDTGVRMEGDAVRSLTVMFLEMWNAIKKTDTDYTAYFPEITYTAKQTGYVQPYADNPLDDEHTGENVYMNVLNSAREYAYFITPYLLISDEMKKAFTLAARRGVDVRIITPGIPDKKFVYQATRSYYNRLVKKGVRIFEYTPGFCHAKQCVSDDKAAVVGTINLDYRSLYHHFENAAAFYHKDAVAGVKADFDHLFEECHEVTEQYRSHRSTALRIGQCILRLFAPLL